MLGKLSSLVSRNLVSFSATKKKLWHVGGNSLYLSFEEARIQSGSQTYESEDLVDVVVEKTLRFVNTLESGTLDMLALRTLVPFASMGFRANLKVVDFGGAAGYHYFVARKTLPTSVAMSWSVIETESMAARSHEAFQTKSERQELSFFPSLNRANLQGQEIDLVFSSGALCFAPDPAESLKELMALGAKYIYITRTPFSEGQKSLFSVHKSRLGDNGPGLIPDGFNDREVRYPIAFDSRDNIEKILNLRYQIRYRIDEGRWGAYPDNIRTWGYFCELRS